MKTLLENINVAETHTEVDPETNIRVERNRDD
jgi:hypothetical protein